MANILYFELAKRLTAMQRIHETWPIRTCITFGGLSTAQQHFNFESLQNGPGGQIT
jgi:hypothetical protein